MKKKNVKVAKPVQVMVGLSRLFFISLLCFLCPSCKEETRIKGIGRENFEAENASLSNDERFSVLVPYEEKYSSSGESKPIKRHPLTEEQRGLVKEFIENYPESNVDDILESVGIGYEHFIIKVPEDSERFHAQVSPTGLLVVGDLSAHEKIGSFLKDGFTREFINTLFEETRASNIEWGVSDESALRNHER